MIFLAILYAIEFHEAGVEASPHGSLSLAPGAAWTDTPGATKDVARQLGATRKLSGTGLEPVAGAARDSVTLAVRYQQGPEPFPPTAYFWPYIAGVDTLMRLCGAGCAASIPPSAVTVEMRRDLVRYVTIPRWGVVQGFAIAFRLTNYSMGDSVPAELPQLTAGRVNGSPQTPLTWVGDTSVEDTIDVRLIFRPFVWKQPCFREDCP